jgi:hypothetical protein
MNDGQWGYPVMTMIRHWLVGHRTLCGLKNKVLWPDLTPTLGGGQNWQRLQDVHEDHSWPSAISFQPSAKTKQAES